MLLKEEFMYFTSCMIYLPAKKLFLLYLNFKNSCFLELELL
jgi:hypothetical protein